MADIPPGWATVDSAAIAAVASLLGTILYFLVRLFYRLKRVEGDTKVTRDHVANAHVDQSGEPINMRDDQDEKHKETMAAVESLAASMKVGFSAVAKDIGGIRHELRTLHENDTEHMRQANRDRERMDRLEQTTPQKPNGDHP